MNENKAIELFDSSKLIDEKTRLRIKLRKTNDEIPSSWEIGNLINNLSSYYYKVELLNVISKAIENEISPKNIFILNESFKLNQSYRNLDTMMITDKQIQSLYTIGCPESLYPNKDIFILRLIFETFRTYNQYIFKHTKKHMNKDKLSEYTNSYFNIKKNFNDVIEDIFNDSKRYINVLEEEIKQKIIIELKRVKQEKLKRFNQYIKDEMEFERAEYLLSTHKSYESGINKRIYKEYYTEFFRLFVKVSRPVICIYYEVTHQVQILSIGHINKNKRNNTFFDVKNISHNSPLVMDIITSAVNGVCTIIKTKNEISNSNELQPLKIQEQTLNNQILQEELETTKIKKEVQRTELELKRIELEKKKMELQEKKNELSKEYSEDIGININNAYLSNEVCQLYSDMQDGTGKLLKNNKMMLEDIQVLNHINVKA